MKTLSFCYVITLLAFVFALPLSLQAQVLQWERFPILDSVYEASIFTLTKTRFGLFTSVNNEQTLYSHDNGRSWQKAKWKGLSGDSAIFPGSPRASADFHETPSRLFSVISWRRLCVSLDSGKSWEIVDGRRDNSAVNDTMYIGTLLAVDTVLFNVTSYNLYRSQDHGKTWQRLFFDSLIRTILMEGDEIVALTHTYPGGFDERRVVSRDLGTTWKYEDGIPLPFRRNSATRLEQIREKSFIARQRIEENNVLRFNHWLSNDSGKTWQTLLLLTGNETFSQCIAVGKFLILATNTFTNKGIFISQDDGQTWQKESGLGVLPDGRFAMFTLDAKTLYATVSEKGVYRADVSSLTSVVRAYNHDIGGAYSLFPNPTSERAELTFTLPRSGRARLALYSALGVEVWRSEEALFAAGEGRIVIDARGLPTGVYMYRLSADGAGVSVGRVVVAR